MNPCSAIALVSAMPGPSFSAFTALEMASLLAAQQTSKTARLAVANAPLNHIPRVLFFDPMQCPSSANATEQRPPLAFYHTGFERGEFLARLSWDRPRAQSA